VTPLHLDIPLVPFALFAERSCGAGSAQTRMSAAIRRDIGTSEKCWRYRAVVHVRRDKSTRDSNKCASLLALARIISARLLVIVVATLFERERAKNLARSCPCPCETSSTAAYPVFSLPSAPITDHNANNCAVKISRKQCRDVPICEFSDHVQ